VPNSRPVARSCTSGSASGLGRSASSPRFLVSTLISSIARGQARTALRRAQRADEGDTDVPDAVAEVAERTTAVLAAYRELSALPHPDAAPEEMADGTP
jgi:hypothetical protein